MRPPPIVARSFDAVPRRKVILSTLLIVALGCDHARPSTPGGVFDAGPIFADDTPKVSHTFTVKNTTGRTVQIQGEAHSCVCTKVEYEKHSLKPGETMSLTMEVTVSTQKIVSDLVCSLRTDDPLHPRWNYHVLIQSFPKVVIVPSRIELGQISAQSPKSMAKGASLIFFGLEEPRLPSIKHLYAPDRFTVVIGETPQSEILSNGVRETRFPVGFRVKGEDVTTGTFAEPLNFDVMDTPVSALVVWKSTGPLSVSPSSLFFGLLDLHAAPKRLEIVIRSTNGSRFRLTGGDGGNPSVRVETGDSASELMAEHQAEIVFDPAQSGSRRILSGTATIQTDLDGAGVCSVHWSAFLRMKSSHTAKLTRSP